MGYYFLSHTLDLRENMSGIEKVRVWFAGVKSRNIEKNSSRLLKEIGKDPEKTQKYNFKDKNDAK